MTAEHRTEFVEFLRAQKKAIELYKWLESEKACHDLGLSAELAWIKKYAAEFRKNYEALQIIRKGGDMPVELKVKKLFEDAITPVKPTSEEDACFDVFAHNWKRLYRMAGPQEVMDTPSAQGVLPGPCVDAQTLYLNPGERVLIGTGIVAVVPPGHEIQVRPRSGLALKEGLTVLNTPGTVDAPYRGELGVILINHSGQSRKITKGDRIAQIAVKQVVPVTVAVVEDLEETGRGAGGFGDSGKN